MAVYAVGDIQGCYDALRCLLDRIDFDPAHDQLWCVGDLVNRGPDSLGVLRHLKSLGDACCCVLGNHDLHLLALAAGGDVYKRDTLHDIMAAEDRDELIEWLRHRPLLHHDADLGWCMVHAGLHPGWSLDAAKRRASDVEAVIQGEGWQDFCRQLHHHGFPTSEPEDSRQASIFSVAVFTRSRYCTGDGRYNWHTRSGSPKSDDEQPWFALPAAWAGQCRVVYGHWAALGLVDDQAHVLGLDSGCVWGGKLSAARLDVPRPLITQVECVACQSH
ncbi:MAG: symmetrical bis(5'-nucleosyl)-tetraphosphatase [Mariprofundaceae bacterium]